MDLCESVSRKDFVELQTQEDQICQRSDPGSQLPHSAGIFLLSRVGKHGADYVLGLICFGLGAGPTQINSPDSWDR